MSQDRPLAGVNLLFTSNWRGASPIGARASIRPAASIFHGELGIAAADIDGDGRDEIYVCSRAGCRTGCIRTMATAGLRDISEQAGLHILDNTPSALFADLRNSGHQDLVLLRNTEPHCS